MPSISRLFTPVVRLCQVCHPSSRHAAGPIRIAATAPTLELDQKHSAAHALLVHALLSHPSKPDSCGDFATTQLASSSCCLPCPAGQHVSCSAVREFEVSPRCLGACRRLTTRARWAHKGHAKPPPAFSSVTPTFVSQPAAQHRPPLPIRSAPPEPRRELWGALMCHRPAFPGF